MRRKNSMNPIASPDPFYSHHYLSRDAMIGAGVFKFTGLRSRKNEFLTTEFEQISVQQLRHQRGEHSYTQRAGTTETTLLNKERGM
jgi:hypothetical protein